MARYFRIMAVESRLQRVIELLEAEGFESEPLEISPFCRVFTREPAPAGSSLAAFFGYLYIQDKASMLPPLALAPPPGSAVLDLCASPGGKALFLSQLCGEDGFTLANEPPGARLGLLRQNLERASLPQVASCVYDGAKIPLPDASFNHILLDAPCSGWGTSEKNPLAPKIWRGKKIASLIALQRALLRKAAALLAPGGRLLYSTCTTNPDENDAQIMRLLEESDLRLAPLEPFPGFEFEAGLDGALRVDGHASSSQGFYLALLEKPGEAATHACERRAEPEISENACFPQADVSRWLRLPQGGEAGVFGEAARFLPRHALELLPAGFKWQGHLLGKSREGRFTPAPRLRAFIKPGAAPRLEFEKTGEIRDLLAGRSKSTGLAGNCAALYWRDLPLGFTALRDGRPTPHFR